LALELSQSSWQLGHRLVQLYEHYELLIRWNQRMNLTTVKPGPEMVIRHYCESLFFAAPSSPGNEIFRSRIGLWAGFPGIPMAILKPEWHVTLVESSQRKAVFLRESSRHLRNVSVRAERIENTSEHGDWVVARAVDPEEVLSSPSFGAKCWLMLGEDDFSSIRANSHCMG
jgi:16S rRNA (guanine527-N7)-methyltransferase